MVECGGSTRRCETDIEALYEQLSNGHGSVPVDDILLRKLCQRAWEAARSDDLAVRKGGLRVAGAIGGERGLDVAMAYLTDADTGIRRAAFEMAVRAGDVGIGLIRETAENTDEGLAVDAIALLTQRVDRASTTLMRKLLRSPHGRVRASAARLLGLIAGFAVVRELETCLNDVDEDVRRGAQEALNRIMDQGGPVLTPPPPGEREVAPPPAGIPMAPPAPSTPLPAGVGDPVPNLSSLRSAATTNQEAMVTPPAPEPAKPQELVPLVPNDQPKGVGWLPADGIPLPSQLPTEALALVRLLGQVSGADRPAVIDSLRRCGISEIGDAVSGYRSGNDVHRGRGAAIAAAAMGNQRWVSALRNYLRDPDAGVRNCAIVAIAGIATPSLLPQMARLSGDADPGVRVSTAWALGAAGRKLGAQGMVRGYLQNMASDGHVEVKAAAEEALAALAG